ncbi:putative arabinose efflux permease, MFS family [Streptoalloteichus tenebrarius]|uniref:Arabinose efflux permease, MFS family n=1 Tax=Streptoalloteichus tenebrarius (strain ATCC 17920 / DSM 40477 / JCM 4838 / CBS 697.72 / NBRC 16177 / NCIMB 11028 / NRRL B-12390 / A12253. 1 / ISP 5477) TaxID=1933 RepID=Q70IX8_STRSD|nr:MFS transporter [Streptoalloteichus tenebrarius]MCP2261250.1 putative arabinose efflux permease, MFS family [Streptoalloteichus tenebrarius]BFF04442.1 MFS transporter [Streptoalloteichus tenebrarius]CAE22476.1 putative transport protein [Streptoalloteichus tenebrarius]CAH18551.1 putative transport protein, TobT [Streptoalloteichus tenebrarius]
MSHPAASTDPPTPAGEPSTEDSSSDGASARGTGSRRTTRRLCLFFGLHELVPFFPLYPLLFADHGLSTAGISGLLAFWSVTAFVLEVPSGVLGDMFSRRRLLALGVAVRACGFGLWVAFPSPWAFAAGFLCWGLCDALTSGTLESLVYDELRAAGATGRYAAVMGSGRAVSLLSTLTAITLAGPLFALGGYPAVGVVSLGSGLACALAALSFSEPPREQVDSEGGGWRWYVATFRAGVSEVRGDRVVLRAVLVAASLHSMTAIDEYFPMLARANGASTTMVPVLVAVTVVCAAVGSGLVGRTAHAPSGALGLALLASAALLAAGALSGLQSGMLAVGVSFGLVQWALVLADTRLQDAITGPARATVTSVVGFGSEVASVGFYLAAGAVSTVTSMSTLVAWFAVPLVLIAVVAFRWLRREPCPTGQVRPEPEPRRRD